MSSLETRPIRSIQKKKLRTVAFVGLDRAGKTTTLKRLSQGLLVDTKPTAGFSTEIFNFLGLRFNVFDLGGQEAYQVFWEQFLPQREAVVFFIDSADTKRLAKVRIALKRVFSIIRHDTIVMILANKQDLPNALGVPDLVKALNLPLAKAKNVPFFPVSAKTGVGIYDAFQWLASALEIDISKEMCTLYGFYVYMRKSGVPVITQEWGLESSGLTTHDFLLNHDPSLIVGLHSAIGSYANEMAKTEIESFSFKSPKNGQVFQVSNVRYKDLVCMIITPEEDSTTISSAIGRIILKYAHERMNPTELVPALENFYLNELLDLIAPFLKNSVELRAHLEAQVSNFDSPSLLTRDEQVLPTRIEPIEEEIKVPPLVLDDSSSKIMPKKSLNVSLKQNPDKNSILVLEKTEKSQSSALNKVYKANKSPSQAISIERDQKARTTVFDSFSQYKKQEPTPKDDEEFFRLSVVERIQHLKQSRKRLKEA
ncbi:MAG: ADP-ribosylation factor family protein [Candidatus Hermodarchaeota archaeon]